MFMLTKTHEAAMQEYRAYETLLDQLQSALGFFSRDAMLATLKMARDMHDQKEAAVLFPAFAAERERFKLATPDLAKQAERSEGLKSAGALLAADRDHWREQALRDEKPAQMWRDYLKRSRDRKKGVGK